MGNWSNQQEVKKEAKEKDKVRRETLGKFFFDLAKLAFAGLFVSWLTPLSTNTNNSVAWSVLIGGVIFTVVFAMIGNKILKQEVDMNMLAMTYIIGSVIGIVFLSWLYTKRGKKWLENL